MVVLEIRDNAHLPKSKMSTEAELRQLIDRDIADGRRHLQDSHNNLEKVAAYCEGNYLQVRLSGRSGDCCSAEKSAVKKQEIFDKFQNMTVGLGFGFVHLYPTLQNLMTLREAGPNHQVSKLAAVVCLYPPFTIRRGPQHMVALCG